MSPYTHVQGLLHQHLDTDSDNNLADDEESGGDLNSPWKGEFQHYLNTVEAILHDMDIVEWWGVHAFDHLINLEVLLIKVIFSAQHSPSPNLGFPCEGLFVCYGIICFK